MKIWKEYSKNISEYYEWVSINLAKKWNANLISYNANGLYINKDEFFEFCLHQIQKEMISFDSMYIYLIVSEEIINPNSKVERYKKSWRKILYSNKIDYLEFGKEVEYINNNKLYYVSLFRTSIRKLDKVLSFIDSKSHHCYLFISENDYFGKIKIEELKFDNYIKLNRFGEIDYPYVIEKRILNHDLICRYGCDSLGIELAFIFKIEDKDKYYKNI